MNKGARKSHEVISNCSKWKCGLNTRLDPIKGPGVGRNRLFDGRKSGSESFTPPVAWRVGDVLTVSFERLVSVSDEGFDLVVPQSQTDGAHRLLTLQRNSNDIKRPF